MPGHDQGSAGSPEAPRGEARSMTLQEKIHDIVQYHQPDAEGIARITDIRTATEQLILAIALNCPSSPDRSAAIRKAREAMMTANASIVVPQVIL